MEYHGHGSQQSDSGEQPQQQCEPRDRRPALVAPNFYGPCYLIGSSAWPAVHQQFEGLSNTTTRPTKYHNCCCCFCPYRVCCETNSAQPQTAPETTVCDVATMTTTKSGKSSSKRKRTPPNTEKHRHILIFKKLDRGALINAYVSTTDEESLLNKVERSKIKEYIDVHLKDATVKTEDLLKKLRGENLLTNNAIKIPAENLEVLVKKMYPYFSGFPGVEVVLVDSTTSSNKGLQQISGEKTNTPSSSSPNNVYDSGDNSSDDEPESAKRIKPSRVKGPEPLYHTSDSEETE